MAKNTPIPWKLRTGPAPDTGALTIEQIRKIGTEYRFGDDDLLRLSRKIATVQSVSFKLSQPELLEPKRDRGSREIEKAIIELRKANKSLGTVRATIDRLGLLNPLGHDGIPNPAEEHLADFKEAEETIENFCRYLEVVKRGRWVVFSDHPDGRKVRDVRREVVCWTIFNFWEEQGRKLSYTTDAIRKERGGELFSFIKAIVACMTEPRTMISGNTLKQELDRY